MGLRCRLCGHGRHKDLRGRWLVSERSVRAHGVVVSPPALDDDLRLGERIEDLSIEQFILQAGVERLDESVLPWAARRDGGGLGPDRRDPRLNGLRDELRANVGTDMAPHGAQDEAVRQNVEHVDRFEPPVDTDRQAFMGELINDVEDPVLLPLICAILDKIITPDMVRVTRPQPDTGTIGQPEASLLRLLLPEPGRF